MIRSSLLVHPVRASLRQLSSQSNLTGRVARLENRSVIRLAGEESRDFLQGLITNDIRHLAGAGSSIYTQFLNKAGRVLYDSIIYGSGNDGELFLECDHEIGPELRKHMMIYRIRRKIAIDLVGDEYSTWAAWNCGELPVANSCPDPRVKELGRRILTRSPDADIPKELSVATIKDYNQQRFALGVAEGVKEIVPGKAFPLEFNCDYMHGLSVHKGCYLGQEFTARTYHTGVVRKRIMPVELETSISDDLVNKEVLTADGKPGGKIRGHEGSLGIGLLRIELVTAAQGLLVNKSVGVKTWKPSWWPIVAPKSSATCPE